jgi:flagellar hook-associated protein 1
MGSYWGEAEMTGLAQLVQIGLSGLEAATEGMQTVSNNTANVNTPGYNVEGLNQAELPGIEGGPGLGTDVTSIQRAFDQFTYQEVVGASSANAAAQAVETTTQNLAAAFPVASGGAGGLGAALGSFFAAANTVARDATSIPNRQVFLGDAQSLAAAFRSVGGELATSLTTLNAQLAASVQQINGLTQQIAAFNQQIASQAGSSNGAPNSLLDQRDQLVQQLAQQVGVTLIPDGNGEVDVYTSNGAELVNGTTASQLVVTSGSFGDGSVAITDGPNGQDLTSSIAGGQLGGLLTSRSQIVSTQDSVGALAAGLAAAVNQQQSLGLDLQGNLGGPLFSVAEPTVYPSRSNTGSGTLTAAITDPTSFTPADFILTKTASGFTATNSATGQVTTLGAGPTVNLDGMRITVSGTVATGDNFKLEPTGTAAQSLTVAITDPSAVAAAFPYVATSANNVGNVQATVGSPIAGTALPPGTIVVPASDFGQQISIKFTSGSSFEVLSSSGSVISSGTLSASSGAEIAIAYPSPPAPAGEVVPLSLSAGTAAAGDTFTFTPGGAGSNGNIVGLADLANQDLLSGQTLGNAYSTLVSIVGSRGQEAQLAAQTTQAVLTRAQNTQQSISGVNLDQEATKLVSYQQAYQASARVIATAQTLFDSLLNAL